MTDHTQQARAASIPDAATEAADLLEITQTEDQRTMDKLLWVACSQDVSLSAYRESHAISHKGALTTLCGATASHPEVWRRNSTKPRCRLCEIRSEAHNG